MNCVVSQRTFVGIYVRLDYRTVNPVLAAMQKLGVANPASLAWELLPYSFVVDWFLPIGQYLNSWTADLGLSFIGGSQTVIRRLDCSLISATNRSMNQYRTGSGHLSGGGVHNWSIARTVMSSSPAPRLPAFKNPLSLGHFANGMSLLVSAMRR